MSLSHNLNCEGPQVQCGVWHAGAVRRANSQPTILTAALLSPDPQLGFELWVEAEPQVRFSVFLERLGPGRERGKRFPDSLIF
jgi:hypothetical protein